MGEYSEAFVAFDVAKMKHAVAVARVAAAVRSGSSGEIANRPAAIGRTIKKLASRYERLHVCLEAGPTGYGLRRL